MRGCEGAEIGACGDWGQAEGTGGFPRAEAEERGVKPEETWASPDSKEVQDSAQRALGTPSYTKSSLGDYRAGAIRRNVSWRWEFRLLLDVWAEGILAPGLLAVRRTGLNSTSGCEVRGCRKQIFGWAPKLISGRLPCRKAEAG